MPTTLEQPAPSFADVWRMFQETDLKFKETERVMKERAAETDNVIKNLSKRLGDIGNRNVIKNLSKRLGDIGNRLGEFVEHMVSPAVVRLFQASGVEVHAVYPGVEAKRGGGVQKQVDPGTC